MAYNEGVDPTKTALRQSLQQTRLALSSDERLLKSTAIIDRLWELFNWSDVKGLHCFEPIMRLGEVDLVDFVIALELDMADIPIYTSRKMGQGWQIVSVKTDQPVAVPKFDVIIVPMLGFDPTTLHRIGYGGGYYDKLLASQPQARKIGVCFELGKTDEIPSEPHDIPLDMIVTESDVYKR